MCAAKRHSGAGNKPLNREGLSASLRPLFPGGPPVRDWGQVLMATSSKSATMPGGAGHGDGVTRRDFLFVAAGATGAVGVAATAWPFLNNVNPAADVLALASVEL